MQLYHNYGQMNNSILKDSVTTSGIYSRHYRKSISNSTTGTQWAVKFQHRVQLHINNYTACVSH